MHAVPLDCQSQHPHTCTRIATYYYWQDLMCKVHGLNSKNQLVRMRKMACPLAICQSRATTLRHELNPMDSNWKLIKISNGG